MGSNSSGASLSGSLSLQINGAPSGPVDYEQCYNLPTINGTLVKGDLTSKDLGMERGYDAYLDEEDEEHLILSI